jgi:hypothetical protein
MSRRFCFAAIWGGCESERRRKIGRVNRAVEISGVRTSTVEMSWVGIWYSVGGSRFLSPGCPIVKIRSSHGKYLARERVSGVESASTESEEQGMAFVMCFEEGPELNALVRAVANAFEIEGDITVVVTTMARAFGVQVVARQITGAAERAVQGLLLLPPEAPDQGVIEGEALRGHTAVARPLAG